MSKEEFAHFGCTAVREDKDYFSEYNLKGDLLDGFYVRHLERSIHYKTLTSVIQLFLVYIMVKLL